MAFTRKSSAAPNRVHGEVPDLPDGSVELQGWWSEFRAVYDRVRDKSLEGETYTSLEKKKLEASEIFTSAEKQKLLDIEDKATSDQTAHEIKTLLNVLGDVVGTDNEGQEIENKVLGGGSF